MAAIDLSATMDAMAVALKDTVNRVYAWPADSVTVPAAVVGYPTDLNFDLTFQRGGDRAAIPVYFLVGKVSDRTARDRLSEIISGATGIKTALDGDLDGAVQSLRVQDCRVEEITIGGVAYLSATFTCDVLT